MADDIIRAFLDRLALFAPPAEVTRVAAELRQEWGGARVYVPKKDCDVAGKVQRLAGSLAAGRPLREAMECAGVRKSQGYLYLRLRTRPR